MNNKCDLCLCRLHDDDVDICKICVINSDVCSLCGELYQLTDLCTTIKDNLMVVKCLGCRYDMIYDPNEYSSYYSDYSDN